MDRGRLFRHSPLLVFRKYDLKRVQREFGGLGAFQHAVLSGQAHNSHFHFIAFDDLPNHAIDKLHKGQLANLKAAVKNGLVVRRIVDEESWHGMRQRVYYYPIT